MADAGKPAWPAVSLAAAHAILTAPGSPFEMTEAIVRGRPMRVWKNAPPTLREIFLAGRAFGEDDEIISATLDLELGSYLRRTIFNFEKHRRIEHYGLITERTGSKTEV